MDIMKLMKQAQKFKKIQKEISKTVIEHNADGSALSITGAGELKNFQISSRLFDKGKDEIEKAVTTIIITCLKKQQDLQKEKVKEIMGGLKLPDILS